MYCGGFPISLQLSLDLYSPRVEPWPGTTFEIPVPPRSIEGRFGTSAKPVVGALLARRNLAAELYIGGKNKGCDIGYALAASSREGANNVDARTVTAF